MKNSTITNNLRFKKIVLFFILMLLVFSCKVTDEEAMNSTLEERNLPTGIAGDMVYDLSNNLRSSGYSQGQTAVIVDGASTYVFNENLEESTNGSSVAPVVLKGAVVSLSDSDAGISTADEKLAAIDVIVNSVTGSLNGKITASDASSISSQNVNFKQDPGPYYSSLGAAYCAIMKKLAEAVMQQLDEAGIPEANMVSAIKSVSKCLIKSLLKIGVDNDDLLSVTKDITTAAVGAINETGLSSSQTGSAVEAVVVGVMLGLKEYGADSETIVAIGDDVATGAANGLADAGISSADASNYVSTITGAISTGAQEAGLSEAEVATVKQNADTSVSLVLTTTTGTTATTSSTSTAGFTVSTITGNTGEDTTTTTFTVKLNSQPTADVTIAVSSSDTGEGTVSPSSLTFTSSNWNTTQTVTVTGVNDSLVDGNQTYSVVLAAASSSDTNYNGQNPSDVSVTNTDDEAHLPDTGQTSCYNNTVEITCPASGESFYGQDGHYTINSSSYTVNTDTITDNHTKLIWQRSEADTRKSLADAVTYCDDLTLPAGGYTDWRLPTAQELVTIVDLSTYYPSIDAVFTNTSFDEAFWSSTLYAGSATHAWYLNFDVGYVSNQPKTDTNYVRCVLDSP